MATVLGSLLMGNVLPKSAAEKTFHPWWDVLEDYLVVHEKVPSEGS